MNLIERISSWFTKSPVSAVLPPSMNWDWLNSWTGTVVSEPFTGAWQRNQELRMENILTYHAVYACITLIAQDMGKLRLRLVAQDSNGIWQEVDNPAFSPVLRRPNRYQTRQKFFEQWEVSKLTRGNTYVLKERDNRGVVTALYILNPDIVRPMVSDLDGSIWYQCGTDHLVGIEESNTYIPQSEIIHDVYTPLYHPLCGVAPLTACGLAALQGLNIQRSSVKFFANGAKPSGILTAPGTVSEDTAKRLKEQWEANYTGSNIGKDAVLGDGLKYEGIMITAQDSQLINQLKMTELTVCTAFRVPPHKIGIGQMPNYNNIEALDQGYYSNCLQPLIESCEALLDEGLSLSKPYGTEFDLDDLLRMDTATQIRTYGEGVSKGIMAPNEARKKLGLGPAEGGDTPYLQQQNYSLEALNKRDSKEDPFATKPTTKPAQSSGAQEPQPEPQKALPPPIAWDEASLLKGLRDAAA